ncbi:hypothetical protein LGAA44_490005 [Leuconostoc gasicomitatum]|nr:hypothetical protein LGAA44_490005 [Leuconostoc gasicomitatum]
MLVVHKDPLYFKDGNIAQKSINWTIFIQLLRQYLRYDFDYKN